MVSRDGGSFLSNGQKMKRKKVFQELDFMLILQRYFAALTAATAVAAH